MVDGDTDRSARSPSPPARPGPAIRIGYSPVSVAVSPSGTAAYVVNMISGTVTPVSASTDAAGAALSVGLYDYPDRDLVRALRRDRPRGRHLCGPGHARQHGHRARVPGDHSGRIPGGRRDHLVTCAGFQTWPEIATLVVTGRCARL